MKKIKEWFNKNSDMIKDFSDYVYKVFIISSLILFIVREL